ncbi:hypothetical protein JNL27_14455 [bacterium]|nr:hypothetical protein [bacterium]
MTIEYLNKKTWAEISREERLFCAELYFQMRKDIKPFLDLLEQDNLQSFEIGYEVCFYRDVLKEYGKSVKIEKLPQKRTFDLVLMSNKEIHIIEAKAQQGFETDQLQYFQDDRDHLKKLFSIIGVTVPHIYLYAIHSSKYTPSEEVTKCFTKLITWQEIANRYQSAQVLFKRADEIYEARYVR